MKPLKTVATKLSETSIFIGLAQHEIPDLRTFNFCAKLRKHTAFSLRLHAESHKDA